MNYSNITTRVRRAPQPAAEVPMILCRETDRRGTHLRLRKATTLVGRAARRVAAAASLIAAFATGASAQFQINATTSLFAPSFRSTTTPDANNTTWFGWTGNIDGVSGSGDDGGFDGATLNNLIDNPAVIVSAAGLNGTLNQVGVATILASSKNIFAGDFTGSSFEARLTLQIPTNGTPGVDGFTTIILQGVGSLTGNGTQLPATPGAIAGVSPTFIYGLNANPSRQQWWAKYEIPGNAASYTVEITLPGGAGINPGSVRELVVDTKFSLTGFAPDTAVVPEPGSATLFGLAASALFGRRRRS